MHLALWTRLDIFPTCVILAQYQNFPSHIHFEAVKQLVGYLRLHPNIPLVFDCSRFREHVGAFDLQIDHLDPLDTNFPGPDSYYVASVQLLPQGHLAHGCSIAAMNIYYSNDTVQQVPSIQHHCET
jgi:hypothetical protein